MQFENRVHRNMEKSRALQNGELLYSLCILKSGDLVELIEVVNVFMPGLSREPSVKSFYGSLGSLGVDDVYV